jgi:hypothetical protein
LIVQPPIGKHRQYAPLPLTVIEATEPGVGTQRLRWKLWTDLSVDSTEQAVEKLRRDALRWKIETFHKILKSGCQVAAAKLAGAERLTKLTALRCMIAWRVFWLTMLRRQATPATAVATAFTTVECALPDQLIGKARAPSPRAGYLEKLARLGGYLARLMIRHQATK